MAELLTVSMRFLGQTQPASRGWSNLGPLFILVFVPIVLFGVIWMLRRSKSASSV